MTEKSALSRDEPRLREASSSGILLAAPGKLPVLALKELPVLAGRIVPDVFRAGDGAAAGRVYVGANVAFWRGGGLTVK